jgi:hypothetical protein
MAGVVVVVVVVDDDDDYDDDDDDDDECLKISRNHFFTHSNTSKS